MKWMLFKRKSNGQAYFFNGEWPISVSPSNSPSNRIIWNAAEGRGVMQIIERTANDIIALTLIMESKKTTFTHDDEKYIIVKRGEI